MYIYYHPPSNLQGGKDNSKICALERSYVPCCQVAREALLSCLPIIFCDTQHVCSAVTSVCLSDNLLRKKKIRQVGCFIQDLTQPPSRGESATKSRISEFTTLGLISDTKVHGSLRNRMYQIIKKFLRDYSRNVCCIQHRYFLSVHMHNKDFSLDSQQFIICDLKFNHWILHH